MIQSPSVLVHLFHSPFNFNLSEATSVITSQTVSGLYSMPIIAPDSI